MCGDRFYSAAEENAEGYELSLFGSYQRKNAENVLAAVRALRDRGWNIPEEAVRKGLKETVWPARFEILRRDPAFILDAGHNPQCAGAVAGAVREYFKGEKVTFLIGMLRDKDYSEVIEILLPCASDFICVTPESDRALNSEDLASRIRELSGKAAAYGTIEEGLEEALRRKKDTVAFGSFYMAGKIRRIMRERGMVK